MYLEVNIKSNGWLKTQKTQTKKTFEDKQGFNTAPNQQLVF